MADLFKEIIPAILQTGESVITPESEKTYPAYMVNRALSYHYDCILWANEMNMNPHLDPFLQFSFHLNKVRKYRRPFQKWQKNDIPENLEAVKEYFNLSSEKAKEALVILSEVQIEAIRKKVNKGGNDDRRPNRSNPSRT